MEQREKIMRKTIFGMNRKSGFTLIELIIVVAMVAVLVSLLAPNVIKYLEDSRASKDLGAIDNVYTVIRAEMVDEYVYYITTGGKWISLNTLYTKYQEDPSQFNDNWQKFIKHIFFNPIQNPLDSIYASDEIFGSKTALNQMIYICICDENYYVGVAALEQGDTFLHKYNYYYSGNLPWNMSLNNPEHDDVEYATLSDLK